MYRNEQTNEREGAGRGRVTGELVWSCPSATVPEATPGATRSRHCRAWGPSTCFHAGETVTTAQREDRSGLSPTRRAPCAHIFMAKS